MELHPSGPEAVPPARATAPPPDGLHALRTLLLGESAEEVGMPAVGEITAAAIALATARRRKVLLPLPGDPPAELALVRRGDQVLASCYETGALTEVMVLDREVDTTALLKACATAAAAETERSSEVTRRLAERARATVVVRDSSRGLGPRKRRGGAQDDPGDEVALAFGFNALIPPGPSADDVREGSSQADVHALLFPGELWAWIHGRRVPLARGPIVLGVQCLLAAVRALVDAEDAGRAAHVRLRAGSLLVAVRLDGAGAVSISLGEGDHVVTAAALDVPGATLPILRLASDVLRALVAADRRQARNLRVRSMRAEVRGLRKRVRSRRTESGGFVNRDPDRLRVGTPSGHPAPRARVRTAADAGRLRFAERWRFEIEGLDATTTFLCGDRLVISAPRQAVALCRDSGDVLWVREGLGGGSFMAGQILLRQSPDGETELCDVTDGESFAHARIAPRVGGAGWGIHAGDGSTPPLAILTEGASSLVALDLRNGIPRWRYTARVGARFSVRRVGRILVVVSGDGTVDALDVATGEVVWRYSGRARFAARPAVCGDVVVAASGEVGSRRGALFGIDLFSGEVLWQRNLDTAPSAAPIATGRVAVVSIGLGRRGSLACIDPRDGALRWMVPDPGIGSGAACLDVDSSLVINAHGGRVASLETSTGSQRWARRLSDPLADDVPRRLEPILRSGALFVPAATVHVLRPGDGTAIGTTLPCDLVPDWLRVDERGWVYVAEESGHVSAYAPVPHLTLVRGG